MGIIRPQNSQEVLEFSKKLLKSLKAYKLRNRHEVSRIVLLKRKESKKEDMIKN